MEIGEIVCGVGGGGVGFIVVRTDTIAKQKQHALGCANGERFSKFNILACMIDIICGLMLTIFFIFGVYFFILMQLI